MREGKFLSMGKLNSREHSTSQLVRAGCVLGLLGSMVVGIGECSVSGANRGLIMESLENVRAQALVKALSELRPTGVFHLLNST